MPIDQQITLTEGSTKTAAYRTAHAGKNIGEYFGVAIINQITAQPGCVGIRMYYGLDSSGVECLVLTGVDSSGNDIYNGVLGDRSVKCPPNGATNPLNS